MAWAYLFIAGLFEVSWAIALKFTQGFTRLIPSLVTIAGMALSLGFLGLALKSLPIGTAYAVWTGTGAAGAILVGVLLFGESTGGFRFICLTLIVLGTVGLRLASPN